MAPGLLYRAFAQGSATSPTSAAYILDVDLRTSGLKPQVVASKPVIHGARAMGESLTVRDWCARTKALAGVNGGFFGVTEGSTKEIVGLLAVGSEIVSSGRLAHARGNPRRRYARCVLAINDRGEPRIGWAVGERGHAPMLTSYSEPVDPEAQGYWSAESAVACGPRLIERGHIHVTDHEERLMSPPPLWRTFVGYSLEAGQPRRLVLGVGQSLTFADAAEVLQRYFRIYHRTPCAEAMCLDGGASSQLVCSSGGKLVEVRPSMVAVPDAVVIMTR